MTSNVNTKPDDLPTLQASSSSPSKTSSPPASVPISLYREVASELQTNRVTLQSLKTANHDLIQQNQHLRLEIERVVQSALHLRQMADTHQSGKGTLETFPSTLDGALSGVGTLNNGGALSKDGMAFPGAIAGTDLAAASETPNSPFSRPSDKQLFTQEGQPPRVEQSESTAEVNTGWLLFVIFMIILTAFGTGFLIVRPLLPSR